MNFPKYPYVPFDEPIPAPQPDRGALCFSIDAKWKPYLVGLLKTLLVERTWSEDKEIATGEASLLLEAIITADFCVVEQPGIQMEEDMSCCIRWGDNGQLQVFSCGEWTDVPGKGTRALANGSQPADGAPQPDPGGCEQFFGLVAYGGRWRLPVPVNTGDTVEVSDATGAVQGYTTDIVIWRGANGLWSLGGVLVAGTELFDGLNPLPLVPRDALIAWDGTNYYDCSDAANGGSTTLTIGAGVVNGNLMFLVNQNLDFGTGDFSFQTRMCKQSDSVTRFTHTFDLRLSAAGFNITVPGAVAPLASFVPGVGVQVNNPSGVGGSGALRVARATPRTLQNTVIRVIASTTPDPIGNNGTYNMPAANPIAGAPIEFFPNNAYPTVDTTANFTQDCDAFMAEFDAIFAGNTDTIIQIIVSADGTDPF